MHLLLVCLLLYLCHSTLSAKALCFWAVHPPLLFVHLSEQILLPRYLIALNNFDKADTEYALAPTDELIRLWRSVIKVTAGH